MSVIIAGTFRQHDYRSRSVLVGPREIARSKFQILQCVRGTMQVHVTVDENMFKHDFSPMWPQWLRPCRPAKSF